MERRANCTERDQGEEQSQRNNEEWVRKRINQESCNRGLENLDKRSEKRKRGEKGKKKWRRREKGQRGKQEEGSGRVKWKETQNGHRLIVQREIGDEQTHRKVLARLHRGKC